MIIMKKSLFLLCIFVLTAGNAVSQGIYYGRNKVQYTDFNWMVLSTEHFNIYYYPEMKELAERGAFFAEESYKILENKFSHSITNKIPLIFYSSHLHFQQTNITPMFLPEGVGGFFEFFKGRVVIPSDGSTFRFKRIIRHELVHVFMHSKLYWVQKNQGKTSFIQPPLWFTEGLAELWSGDWDSQSEMVVVDQVLEGTLVPVTQFYSINGTYLMYKEAESFLRFIEKKYGEEKILMLMENILRGNTFEDVFRLVIGKDFEPLNDEWVYALKKKYYPLLEKSEIPRMASVQITDEGFNQAPVYYGRGDDEYIYYISNTTGYTNIVCLPLHEDNPKPKTIIKGERSQQFEAIHFLRSKIDINDEGMLTFVTKSGETDVLYIYDVYREKLADEFQFPGIVAISSPVWSNDKKRIAFAGLNMAGRSDIYILNLDDRSLDQQTDDFYEDKDPTWSPDDRSLAFSSSRTLHGEKGGYNLFIKDVQDETVYQITDGLHIDATPVWSHDGEYLAFTSDRHGASNIFLMRMNEIPPSSISAKSSERENITGQHENNPMLLPGIAASPPDLYIPSEIKQITHFTTGAFFPEFTTDSDILFVAYEQYGYQIRLLENAAAIFEETPVLANGIIEPSTTPWEANRIAIINDVNAKPYKKQYSLDIAQGQVTSDPLFGSTGGMQFVISDILGNDQYYLLLYNTAQTKENFFRSFNFSFVRMSLKQRTNINYGLFHYSGRRYNQADFFFKERYYGGFFGARYPISTFQRLEFSTSFGRSEKDKVVDDQDRIALLLGNYISYVKDNSLWGPTGPLDGERFLISIGYTKDIDYDNVNYSTLIVDLRKYFRLSNRSALAVRLMTYRNKGREAHRFYIGGSWDLRGYDIWRIWGQEINFFSTEYRFPFIDNIGVRFPFGGLGFGAIRGALFFDAARIDDFEQQTIVNYALDYPQNLGSIGVGFRINLGGVLVLRLDIGKKLHDNFSKIGGNTFKQFFFGWDF